jgi:hypothetical protein
VTGQAGDGGGDIAGNIQRWLLRSSADNMRRGLNEQVRRAFGGGRAEREDVWGTATTETVPESSAEAPECAWCPVCRTARRIRESGPGMGGLSGAGDAVATAVQEALSAFDAFLSVRPPAPGAPRKSGRATERPGSDPDGRG